MSRCAGVVAVLVAFIIAVAATDMYDKYLTHQLVKEFVKAKQNTQCTKGFTDAVYRGKL